MAGRTRRRRMKRKIPFGKVFKFNDVVIDTPAHSRLMETITDLGKQGHEVLYQEYKQDGYLTKCRGRVTNTESV